MKAIRFAVLTLLFSALGGFWSQAASAGEAGRAYAPRPRPGTCALAETKGMPGGEGSFSTPVNVKIKLKGSASYRPLSEKSAFKIKFEEALFGVSRSVIRRIGPPRG